MKQFLVVVMLVATLALPGCSTMQALFGDIKTDPAIIGMTGWWLQIGMNVIPLPGATAIPLPSITIGRGTVFRVGVTDEATIKTGEAIKLSGGSAGGSVLPDVISDGALSIETKNSSKAIQAMERVYSPPNKQPEKVKDISP